ncbi:MULTISPECIES: DUF1918 domain-containing protein [unclassified Nocardioides]|uniref:DUF1918 domain-containing protein n=1 Tax=unclassified Nocardioides TaxID=2615069 RepID=UPI00361421A8
MYAFKGDQIVLSDGSSRRAEVLAGVHSDGHPPFWVRWADTGEEDLCSRRPPPRSSTRVRRTRRSTTRTGDVAAGRRLRRIRAEDRVPAVGPKDPVGPGRARSTMEGEQGGHHAAEHRGDRGRGRG